MSKYLKHGMHLVYLDQCVLSRFLNKPDNNQWCELRNVILRGNAARRFLCPMSLEQLVETSALPEDQAIHMDDLMHRLSLGWSLLPEPKLVVKQIIGGLRKLPCGRDRFLGKDLWRRIRHPGALNALADMKRELDRHNAGIMEGANEINALVRNGRRPTRDMLRFALERRTDQYVKQLAAEVTVSMALGGITIRAQPYDKNVKNWASVIVFHLVRDEKLSFLEAQELHRLLMAEKLNSIPTLKIKAELEAMQFYRREKIEPRDQYDITRAACALPYADVFITDSGKASAIRELKLDAAFNTEVFSLKKAELPALLARLSSIAD